MTKQYVLIVHVPTNHADAVRAAIGAAGAGSVGQYSHCSFSTRGTGRFLPLAGAKPFIGTPGKMEEVEEERIEISPVGEDIAPAVIKAMKAAHPYEEVAYHLIEITNRKFEQ